MVQCVHVVLNKALEHAVEEKLILVNPAKKCKIPKNARKVMKILPEALCQAQIVYKMFGMILCFLNCMQKKRRFCDAKMHSVEPPRFSHRPYPAKSKRTITTRMASHPTM